jgi:periplasmic copper chaperone A
MALSIRIAARATALGGAAIAGLLAFAAPASADITVTPTQLTDTDSSSTTAAQPVQGEAARLAFTVTTSSRTANTTKVQVLLPEDTPIAEVYPLSAPDWAPSYTEKKLDRPIPGVHGTQEDQLVTAITWTAVPGKAIKPGQSSVLQVEAGPMPAAAQIVLKLVQTYSDGTTTRSDATVKLSPPTGAAQGHDAHNGTTANPTSGPAAAAQPDGDSGSGGGATIAIIVSVLVIGLLAGGLIGGFAMGRARRAARSLTVPREALDAEEPAEPAEPARADALRD